jgi:hypothetical protein
MKTTKNLNQDSQSPGRVLNPGPPENEAGVLTTGPRRSVIQLCYVTAVTKENPYSAIWARHRCLHFPTPRSYLIWRDPNSH